MSKVAPFVFLGVLALALVSMRRKATKAAASPVQPVEVARQAVGTGLSAVTGAAGAAVNTAKSLAFGVIPAVASVPGKVLGPVVSTGSSLIHTVSFGLF